ncbi:hypothetical protein LIER_09390 [Lithospermum erythrorhizon]|uniref:RNase H type-1 domain-containing protein n=1 Tax=Lithospermum erythrorhizon TaxID=34254 RepID=A0AAV3PH46_LITER
MWTARLNREALGLVSYYGPRRETRSTMPFGSPSQPRTMRLSMKHLPMDFQNSLGADHIHVRTGSQLMVDHVNGNFKIDKSKERLVGYLRRVRGLTRLFRSCHMEHVPRERNQGTDRLSQLAKAEYGTMPSSTPVEWVTEEDFLMKEVMNNSGEGEGENPSHGTRIYWSF